MKKFIVTILMIFFLPLQANAFVFETFDKTTYPPNDFSVLATGQAQKIVFPENGNVESIASIFGITINYNTPLYILNSSTAVVGTLYASMTTTAGNVVVFTTSTPISVTGGTEYYISDLKNGGGSVLKMMWYPDNVYSNASGWDQGGQWDPFPSFYSTAAGDFPSPRDYWVNINGYEGSGGYSTAVYWPTTPTGTCDFSSWSIHRQISDTDKILSDNWSYGVRFGIVPGEYFWGDNEPIDCSVNPDESTNCDEVNITLTKKTPLQPGVTHYAQIYISDQEESDPYTIDEDHLVATSSVWEFIISDATGSSLCPSQYVTPGLAIPTTTTSTAINRPDCNYEWPINRACDALVWLFYPTQASMQNFADLKAVISNKPPFGYVSSTVALFNAFTTSTVSSSSVEMTDLSDFDLLSDLKTFVGYFVYGIAAFWLFRRFTKLSLHG